VAAATPPQPTTCDTRNLTMEVSKKIFFKWMFQKPGESFHGLRTNKDLNSAYLRILEFHAPFLNFSNKKPFERNAEQNISWLEN